MNKIIKSSLYGSLIITLLYLVLFYPLILIHKFDWYDVGTVDNYIKAQKIFKDSVSYSIPKTNGEFLYKVNDTFIKISSDNDFISGRINRSKELDGLVPKLNYSGNNLYSYDWKEGKTLYECDIQILRNFLDFCEKEMWKPYDLDLDCSDFYKNKTITRLEMFLSNRNDSYKQEHIVNGVNVGSIHHLIDNFKWDTIIDGKATKIFHGDLQFDNVVYGEDNKFYLIDWRQNFNGESVGDVYYDLAKMYGGILMSYKLMKNNDNFKCYVDGQNVNFEYKSDTMLDEFKRVYEKWILDMNYDLIKIKKITSLIFLNMAPLHEKEFGDMLFFKSKVMLHNDK